MVKHSSLWNLWHGCIKYSEGCANCYVYRRDESIGKDASIVAKTSSFDLPVQRYRSGEYKVSPGSHLYVCMTSDFFIDAADAWRPEAWNMMRERNDIRFTILTKRIVRFMDCVPPDWGDGWSNVAICSTMESQQQCDIRFPVLNSIPAKHKFVACSPLLTDIDMSKYLNPTIRRVVVGGESGRNARICDYDWVLHIRQQCQDAGVHFYYQQTGARLRKDGRLYYIERKLQHAQARRARINF